VKYQKEIKSLEGKLKKKELEIKSMKTKKKTPKAAKRTVSGLYNKVMSSLDRWN